MRFLRRLLLLTLGLGCGLVVAYQGWILAHVWWWVDHDPTTTAFMQARLDDLRARNPRARLEHRWVPYDRISSHLKRAVVASEDAKFVAHGGFDWEAIRQAHARNRARGRIVAGGSTISQQLAKNLFLSGSRSPLRKAQEAVITVMLEGLMSKRRILEIYLNVIEWGDGVFGAEAAARHHFGTSAARLGAAQAAQLAAIVPNPRYYDRHGRTAWIARKSSVILARMPAAQVP